MNKKLVAIAVAGALALPLAAQAQTANVTLYGRLNMDLEVVRGRVLAAGNSATCGTTNSCTTTNPNVFRVSSNSSRFGIRGTESLGRGLNAIFQIESSVSPDSGGGTLAGRDSFVGLQGGWGTVTVGRFHSPYDDISGVWANAPTLQTSILATGALWAQAFTGKENGGFDDRVANSIRYVSPNYAGFIGKVHYGTGEDARHSGVLTGSLEYTNGPIQVAGAWQHNEKFRGATLDDTAYQGTVAYNFGFIRPAFVYERLKYETPTGNLRRNFWGVSLTAPVGVGTIYGFYGRANDGTGSAAEGTRIGGFAKGSDTSANEWTIQYVYALSKRTSVFTGYHKVDNDRNAGYNFNVNPYGGAGANPCSTIAGSCGARPEGFALGAWHNF